jgi:hypothetical protein
VGGGGASTFWSCILYFPSSLTARRRGVVVDLGGGVPSRGGALGFAIVLPPARVGMLGALEC